jgi:hypothetical protein
MVIFRKVSERAGQGVDWLIRGHFVVQLLIASGIGKFVRWLITKYAQVPRMLATSIWFLATGLLLWLLLLVFRKQGLLQQQTPPQTLSESAVGIEANIKAVADFYKMGSGPFLDEIEGHFQRLAAHHKEPAERERFLERVS